MGGWLRRDLPLREDGDTTNGGSRGVLGKFNLFHSDAYRVECRSPWNFSSRKEEWGRLPKIGPGVLSLLTLQTLGVEKHRHFGRVECGWSVGGVVQPKNFPGLIANGGSTRSRILMLLTQNLKAWICYAPATIVNGRAIGNRSLLVGSPPAIRSWRLLSGCRCAVHTQATYQVPWAFCGPPARIRASRIGSPGGRWRGGLLTGHDTGNLFLGGRAASVCTES
jgi:hypothetical protein